VREAINYAINKDALIKVAFSGYAIPAEGVLPQGRGVRRPSSARGPTTRPRRASC
jgi:ABC-type transport system substrate-binding protein